MFSLYVHQTDQTPLLLLDVDLLERLGLVGGRCLYGRRLNDDGLVGSSDHLTPDKRELLLVEKNWYLLDLSVWPNDLLDNLDPAWRRLAGLVHLLGLQLDDLRGGLGLLGVHGDGLDAALDDLENISPLENISLLENISPAAAVAETGSAVGSPHRCWPGLQWGYSE